MLKIVHVIGALVAGGAETFVVNLCISMASDVDSYIIILSNRHDSVSNSLINKLKFHNINFYISPFTVVRLNTVVWYRNVVRKIHPDYIHLHTPNTEKVHFLSRLHNLYKLFRTVHNTKINYNFFTRSAIKMNSTINSIACSEAVLNSMDPKIYKGRTCVIENGVDFHWEINSPTLQRNTRKRLGINLNGMHFLSVGRMSSSKINLLPKAQDVIIKAWKSFTSLLDSPANVSLHLLGDGNLINELKILSGNCGTIYFHGVKSNVFDWLLAADFFVMPSRYEGLPIAAIEAIGTGLPCIFSKIPPIISLSPPSCTWVAVDNIFDLQTAFLEAFNSVVLSPTKDDILNFRGKYCISNVGQKYFSVYNQLLS